MQAHPQSALRAIRRSAELPEGLEDGRQRLLRNAHSGIADADDHLIALAIREQRDLPSIVGVLSGVVEQIGQYLGETARNRR